eukprot:COSAG02_NODE_41523_length_393_cov_1.738095_1_plen_73_part_10
MYKCLPQGMVSRGTTLCVRGGYIVAGFKKFPSGGFQKFPSGGFRKFPSGGFRKFSSGGFDKFSPVAASTAAST